MQLFGVSGIQRKAKWFLCVILHDSELEKILNPFSRS